MTCPRDVATSSLLRMGVLYGIIVNKTIIEDKVYFNVNVIIYVNGCIYNCPITLSGGKNLSP